MILFLVYYEKMSGEFTSILDAYVNTKKYLDNVKIKVVAKANKHLKQLRNSLPQNIEIELYNDEIKDIECDICVLSSFYFFQLARQEIRDFIKAKRYLVFDSSSFIIAEYNDINMMDLIPWNATVLCNNFNSRFCKNFKIYYHKIDFDRVISAASRPQLTQNNVLKKDSTILDPLTYNELLYKRNINISFNVSPERPKRFFENIGKSIFEFAYLNKPVYYSPENKCFDDGLTEYLSLFNINDNKEQIIKIPKKELMDKLSFQANDLLLTELTK